MIYLSIIIPIQNEEKFIIDTLKSLIDQDYPDARFELLVVDGMSTDSTRHLVQNFINGHPDIKIRLLDNPGRLSSCARNIGIRESKGQLIGVIDGHVYIPNDQLFMNMERHATENNALCLSRPAPLDVPGLSEGRPYWIAVSRKTWLGHSRSSYIYKCFEGFIDPVSSGFAYDKSLFEKVGYFDECFDAAEDVEFHFRLKKAGIKAFTSPDLLIYSYPRESFLALFKQQTRYGEGRARFVRKHPDGFTKETLIPSCIFLFFILSPFAFLGLTSLPQFFYLVIMCLYWMILLITGFFEAIKRGDLIQGFFVALGVWTTHMGLGWGFIKTLLLPKYVQK